MTTESKYTEYNLDILRRELEEKKKELQEYYKSCPEQQTVDIIKRTCTFDDFWAEGRSTFLGDLIDDRARGRDIILSNGWTLPEYDIAYAEWLLATNTDEGVPPWGFWEEPEWLIVHKAQ